MSRSPVFVALDTPDPAEARALAKRLAGSVGGVKLGLEFFCAAGPDGTRRAMEGLDLPLFLDLKFHDIPNTVAGAIRSVVPLRPRFLTVHAGGGSAMLRAAKEAAGEEASRLGVERPRILAVTVLTSLGATDLEEVGQAAPVADQVRRLALLAREAGMDGAVCSPNECRDLRAACGADFALMVPGIRPEWAAANDQKRVMTPREAMAAGATHLVVGRPITHAAAPETAARRIAEELA